LGSGVSGTFDQHRGARSPRFRRALDICANARHRARPRWGRITEGAGEDSFSWVPLRNVHACADFREPITVRRTKYSRALNTGLLTGQLKAGGTTTPPTCRKTHCAKYTFRQFKAAVDAGVWQCYERLQRSQWRAGVSQSLQLTKVLRGEWKFDGFVVSDYTSVKELINHGLAADDQDAARLALTAGVDMEMVSRLFNQHGSQLLKEGKISQATIDEAVRRILRIKFRLGLFEHPYTDEAL